ALCDAVSTLLKAKLIAKSPIREAVAAVSVGKVNGRLLLDLNYAEDYKAEVDANIAMTASGQFIEVQASAEGKTYTRRELDGLLKLAEGGIRELMGIQRAVLKGGKVRRR